MSSGYSAEENDRLKDVDPHNPEITYGPLRNMPPWGDNPPDDLPETDLRKTGEVIPTTPVPSHEERGLPPEI
jgi:hypothetical protein